MNGLKCIILFFLFFDSSDTFNANIPISLFTEQFHQRLYVIKRLHRLADWISKHCSHCHIEIPQTLFHKQAHIANALQDSFASGNYALTIELIWQQLIAYKFLSEPCFMHDCCTLFSYLLYYQLSQLTQHKIARSIIETVHHQACISKELYWKTEYLIWLYARFIEKKEYLNDLLPIATEQIIGYTQAVTYRFYYIQRLLPLMLQLQMLDQYTLDLSGIHVDCTHPLIIHVQRDIKRTNQLKPLINLWEDINSFAFIDDELLCKEYVILLLHCCSQLIEKKHRIARTLCESISSLYSALVDSI
jgi:hypothetical protein